MLMHLLLLGQRGVGGSDCHNLHKGSVFDTVSGEFVIFVYFSCLFILFDQLCSPRGGRFEFCLLKM